MNVEVQLELQRLQHLHKLQLQALHNEYIMAITKAHSDFSYEVTKLTLSSLQQHPTPSPPQQPAPPQQPVFPQQQMTTEEYIQAVNQLNGRTQAPMTKHHENHPTPQQAAPPQVISQITRKVMEQTTEEEDEKSLEKRKEIQRLTRMLEGESFINAKEKVQKEGKVLWVYRANSSTMLNPPLDENPRQVIVNVIDNDFDFDTFTPSDNAAISAVVGLGVLGGL